QPIRPVYAIFGDDSYFIREAETAVARIVFPEGEGDAAISRFPGAQASLADVRDELFMLPFFSRRRLVIVEAADPFMSRHRKDLEAYVEVPSASGVLILQAKQWLATTNLAKLVEKRGLAIECTTLREKDRGKLVSWLTQYARDRCESQVDPKAAHLLID